MKPQLATVLHSQDIEPTNNAPSQTQDGNCIFKLAPDYRTGNC